MASTGETEFDEFLADLWSRLANTAIEQPEIAHGLKCPPDSDYVRPHREAAMVRRALEGGMTTENELTDHVFFSRYPKRNRRPISTDERNYQQLSQEWLCIRDTLVRPILRGTGPPPGPPAPPSPPVGRPKFRICCLLAPRSLRDPSDLGEHSTIGGTVYTAKAGFVDIAHVRHTADITALVYQQIHTVKGAFGTTIGTDEGQARLTSLVRPTEWLEVARSIAYDSALGYELTTYWIGRCGQSTPIPGYHNSGFSPEDLCSNYLGTVVAERALRAGGTFAAAAEQALQSLLNQLEVQTLVEALIAFSKIDGRWVDTRIGNLNNNCYLRRRNFTRTPWPAGHSSDAPPPAFVTAPFTYAASYDYTHTKRHLGQGHNIPRAQFPNECAAIMAHAKACYGSHFDKRLP